LRDSSWAQQLTVRDQLAAAVAVAGGLVLGLAVLGDVELVGLGVAEFTECAWVSGDAHAQQDADDARGLLTPSRECRSPGLHVRMRGQLLAHAHA
jgi:hypothetical protein